MRYTNQRTDIGLSTSQVAVKLGIFTALKQVATGWTGLCPIPSHQDTNPSFVIYLGPNKEDRGWYCFGCGRGGDATALWCAVKGVRRLEAVKTLDPTYSESEIRTRLKLLPEEDSLLVTEYLRANTLLRGAWVKGRISEPEWKAWCIRLDDALIANKGVAILRARLALMGVRA